MKKKTMTEFVIDEISAVKTPAQEHAQAVLLKSKGRAPIKAMFAKDYDVKLLKGARAALTDDNEGHTHIIMLSYSDGVPIVSGVSSYAVGHDHPYIVTENDEVVIGMASDHSHTIAAYSKTKQSATGNTRQAVVDPEAEDDSATEIVKESDMDELQKANKRIAELEAQEAVFKSVFSMSPDHLAHYKTLSGSDAEAFLKMSDSMRSKHLQAAADANPIVYKSLEGVEVRKNDDPRLVASLKRNDELAKSAQEATEKLEKTAIETEAKELLSNLPGDDNVKQALIKSLRGMDKEVGEGLRALLKAGNGAMKGAFKSLGTEEPASGEVEGESSAKAAEDKLDQLAKAYAATNKISFAKAYVEVLKTDEGQKLYDISING